LLVSYVTLTNAAQQCFAGVSVAIFGIFSCTTFESGKSYLDADFAIVCYDKTHWRYVGGAIIWLLLVPLGIPCFFWYLLRTFKVPHMARLLQDNAWLQEAVQLAWTEGMAQPAIDMAKLNVDSISELHLEALFAFFVHDASADEAAEILSGAKEPAKAASFIKKAGGDEEQPAGVVGRARARVAGAFAGAAARANTAVRAAAGCAAAPPAEVPHQATRREIVLQSLLHWCRTSGDLSITELQWDDTEQEAEKPPAADTVSTTTRSAALLEDGVNVNLDVTACAVNVNLNVTPCAVNLSVTGEDAPSSTTALRCADLPRLQKRAMKEVGFLFGAYRVDCW
jgi:hypothetical protein